MGFRERLLAERAETAARIESLEREHAAVVEASRASNADDEHDPEGATIAFEREQLTALLTQARRSNADVEDALARIDDGTYGTCAGCGRPIPRERLEARPTAVRCVDCA